MLLALCRQSREHMRVNATGMNARIAPLHSKVSHRNHLLGDSLAYIGGMQILTAIQGSNLGERGGMHTVLVVEDETMVRMPVAEFLRDCGYHVVQAANAVEAIAAMSSGAAVSLVFTDIRMPGTMDGLGLADWVHTHHPGVPVLLTSGYAGGRSLPPESGERFIEKPYSQAVVAQRIAALLQH